MTTAKNIVAEICKSDGQRFRDVSLSDLADFFRNGESMRTLLPLLRHANPEVASGGAWIASEVADHTNGREVFDELSQLLGHPDPAVRFWPISSVAYLATANDRNALAQLLSLVADSNTGVRRQALRYVCIIPDSTIWGLNDTPVWPKACLLLADATKQEIIAAARSTEDLTRRLAIAGIMRNFGDVTTIVDELERCLSEDEASELRSLPRCRSNAL